MDYKKWLANFISRFDEWAQSTSGLITLLSRQVSEPLSHECYCSALNTLSAPPPKALIEFYRTAANGCDVTLLVSRPPDFRYAGRENIAIPSTVVCGFSLRPISELQRAKKHLTDTIEVIGKFHQIPKRVSDFIRVACPFWVTRGGDYVAIVEKGHTVPPGVYFVMKETLLEINFAIKYADSFDEWLSFLEDNCYVGPAWSEMCAWHNDGKLKTNPSFETQLLRFLD